MPAEDRGYAPSFLHTSRTTDLAMPCGSRESLEIDRNPLCWTQRSSNVQVLGADVSRAATRTIASAKLHGVPFAAQACLQVLRSIVCSKDRLEGQCASPNADARWEVQLP